MTTDASSGPTSCIPTTRRASFSETAAPDRTGRRHRRIPVPASRRALRLDPGRLQGHLRQVQSRLAGTGRLELVGAWADITERKDAEQAALDANAELQETKRYLTRLSKAPLTRSSRPTRAAIRSLQRRRRNASRISRRRNDRPARRDALRRRRPARTRSPRDAQARRHGLRLRHGLGAKDGTAIPVLISASVLFDEDGQEIGTVGFATDMRERKRERRSCKRPMTSWRERVEERTVELNEARGRLQYLLTVTPGIIYTNQPSDGYVHVRQPRTSNRSWVSRHGRCWRTRSSGRSACIRTTRIASSQEWGRLVEDGGGTSNTASAIATVTTSGSRIPSRWCTMMRASRSRSSAPGRTSTHRKQVEQALGERMALMNDLQNLVAASPAVIYTTQASGDFACTFVSENLKSTMGYAPWEMREDPKFWSSDCIRRMPPASSTRSQR